MAPDVTNADSSSNISSVIVQFNPASHLSIKLVGSHNFATWKAQIFMIMPGHNLFGHLDGTSPTPSKTITQNDRQVENPIYNIWFRQDQLIQNAIMPSVDSTIATTVATASTAKLAWDSLHMAYANRAKFSCDFRCNPSKRFHRLLRGVFAKLIYHELFLKHEELKMETTSIITALVTRKKSNNSNNRNVRRPNNNSQWRYNNCTNAPTQGSYTNNDSTNNPVRYQLCNRQGHTANVCRSQSHNHLEAKADNLTDRSSTTGYIIYLSFTPVSLSTKKERTIACSSTEVEYRAVPSAVDEITWVNDKCLIFKQIPSSDQLADTLTKLLPKNSFRRHFSSKLGVVAHHLA
ncbi:PREDICTED: uncharacterized protein LOC109220808 [Nicotiana attenuata]|uniref:uncharacterized protein LOC109220808 n=1 Tax=Nicotiana attenuata TaxID=49451 RepID=UPI000904BEB3|nr:PREDICTED: uncharacterized protein LOC109220808 [Nicotiana attenuata]